MSKNQNDMLQGEPSGFYETGRTQPPKNRHGLIAVVLVAVIFIAGILRGSYLLNIPLIRLDLPAVQEDMPVRFARSPKLEAAQIPAPSAPVCADVSVELSAAPDTDIGNIRQSTVSVTSRADTGVMTAEGIILSENGYILTSCHILEQALSVSVTMPDGKCVSAAVVGLDRMTNLAVLYTACSDLIPASFGDSAQISVGDAVTPEGTVTSLGAQIVTTAELSLPGAPLLNAQGQIIGVRADPADSHRVIPSAVVKDIAEQLAQKGFVAGRPDPGFVCTELTELDRKFYKLPQGVYISAVCSGNELLPGDVLQRFDDVPVEDPGAFYQMLYAHRVGDTVEVSIVRSGEAKTLLLTLTEAK